MTSRNDATKAIILSCLLLLTVPVPVAQTSPAQTKAKTDATISVSAELVVVPAVVTDHSGEAIKGLGKDDFAITEDGTYRAISLLEEISDGYEKGNQADARHPRCVQQSVGDENAPKRLTVIVLGFLGIGKGEGRLPDIDSAGKAKYR